MESTKSSNCENRVCKKCMTSALETARLIFVKFLMSALHGHQGAVCYWTPFLFILLLPVDSRQQEITCNPHLVPIPNTNTQKHTASSRNQHITSHSQGTQFGMMLQVARAVLMEPGHPGA
eukprot:scaffold310687_cov23-Tisochrysis_lutea.AAC.1